MKKPKTKTRTKTTDYRWLCDRVASWGDLRYIPRLSQDHLERLIALKRTGEGPRHPPRRRTCPRPQRLNHPVFVHQIRACGVRSRLHLVRDCSIGALKYMIGRDGKTL